MCNMINFWQSFALLSLLPIDQQQVLEHVQMKAPVDQQLAAFCVTRAIAFTPLNELLEVHR